jgi:hypothetical protein
MLQKEAPLMREMFFRVTECGLAGSSLDGVFGVDMSEGMGEASTGGTRRNGGRVQGIVARARGKRDE